MKGKRIFWGLIIAVMLLVTVALAVAATEDTPEYTGTVSSANQQLGTVDTKNTIKEKIAVLDKLLDYIPTIAPTEDGYDDFVLAFDVKELEIAKLALAEAETAVVPKDKEAALVTLLNFLENHEVTDEAEGEENLFTAITACKTDIAEKYLEAIKLVDANAKDNHLILDDLCNYIAEFEPELRDDFMTDLTEANLAVANQYLALIPNYQNAPDKGATIRILSLFMKEHPFETTDGYEAFISTYEMEKSAYLEGMEAQRERLHKLNYLSDLDKAPLSNHDYTPSDTITNPNNKTGMLLPEGNLDTRKDEISYIGEEFGMDGDNGYYTFNYDVVGVKMGASIKVANIQQSAVFEFDLTTFGELPVSPNSTFYVNSGSYSANGATWSVYYLAVTGDGHIVEGNNPKKILVENAVTKGEWVHISIVVDYETNNVDLYVDYYHVASFSVAHNSGYIGTPPTFGIHTTAEVLGGEFSLDNVKLYQGRAPRDLDFFTSSGDEEKFVFYANQLDNTDLSLYAKKIYSDTAIRQLENYYKDGEYKTVDPDVIAAVNKIVAFTAIPDDGTLSGYQQLASDLSNYNIEQLKKAVDKVANMPRQESNSNDRTYFLGLADSVLASTGTYIIDSQALSAQVARLNTVRNNLAEEAVLNDFVLAVTDFYAAATIDKMKEAFAKATSIYKSVDKSLASAAFPKFRDAYEKYDDMELVLKDKVIIDNSKKLLACLAYVSTYPEHEWDRNYEYLNTYVVMARQIIEEGLYDTYYKNLGDAIEDFKPMNEHFYLRMQVEYVEHIEDELDRANKSDKYFEKLGICIKLEEYVIENKLDGKTDELDALILEYRALYEELKADREAYDQLLTENTEKFVKICEGLVGSIDYVTMKRICEEASQYYYMMDVSKASTQDAIGIYVARCNEIEVVEAYAEAFNVEVQLMTAPGSNILECIVSAAKYLDKLEVNAPGVKSSIAAFERICANYDKKYASANEELASTFSLAMYGSNANSISGPSITFAFSMVK